MKWGRSLISLVVAVIFGLSLIFVPLVSRVSPTQAAVTWTKYSGEVTLENEEYVVDACVIKDGSTSYKMWYTHIKTDLSLTDIADILRALSLDNLVNDIVNLDLSQFLSDLDDLSGEVSDITGLLDGISTVIGYATSTNGKTWTIQDSEVLAGNSAAIWDSVGAPSVIWDATTSKYKMWYTRAKTDLTEANLQNILNDIAVPANRKNAILDIIDGTSTVIGYASSSDGITWTVGAPEVLAGSNNKIVSSIGDPWVIKNSDTDYEMWYTNTKTDLTQTDLDNILGDIANFGIAEFVDIFDGVRTVIGYATSSDGQNWTVQDTEVIAGINDGIWRSTASPTVIKSGGSYEMWYTSGRTDLAEANVHNLANEFQGLDIASLWTTLKDDGFSDFVDDLAVLDIAAIKNLLDATSTAIGYATSSDGADWTVINTQHLTGSSSSLWSSVAAPSVVKTSTKYEMWYTEGFDDLTWQNILDFISGDDLPIGYASYIPAGGGEGGIEPEPTADDIAEMDPEEAADTLAGMDVGDAGDILGEIGADDPEAAGDILEELAADDPEVAGDILGEVGADDPEVAGDILGEVGADNPAVAGDILEEIVADDPEVAGDILEEIVADDPEVAGNILEEMTTESAAAVMEELTTNALTDVIPEMSEEALTDILPGLSPDTLYDIWANDPDVLFDSLPNAPTEQLAGEDPPEPPADAEDPIIVYTHTTPDGVTTRYLAIRTWAGEWVVVMGTPPPIDQLMIKTKQALTDVETIVDIFDARPSGVVSLPAGQIAWSYFNVSFENAMPEDIELGHITFYVEKDWIEENSIHKWSVALNRYDSELGQWITLPTKRVEEDGTYVYYTATITHFSTFAISGSETLPAVYVDVANLTIDPAEAETGEAITISADITNLTSEAAVYVATLWIDDTVEAGQDVSLEAGETVPISFTVTRNTEGSYEVRLNRLFGSFSVTEAVPELAPAAFTVSNLSITPADVDIGEEVTISILITNTGELTGSYEVTLKIDGVVVATEEVTLAGGASSTVTFTTSQDIAGTYTVTINDLSGTFMVRTPALPPKPTNWWLLGGIIAGVIIIGLVIWRVARQRI